MPEKSSAFVDLLSAAEDGQLVPDLDVTLRALVKLLKSQHAARGGTVKGALQLTIAMAYDGKNVDVATAITTKEPKRLRQRSVMYATKSDELVTTHPSQVSLFDKPRSIDPAPVADAAPVARTLTVS